VPVVREVVVLRALGLGDLLTAVPALRAVRRAFPDARVRLAGPVALAPLVALSGAVDEVVDAAPLAPLPAPLHRATWRSTCTGAGRRARSSCGRRDPPG
jgi:ADP-heptose:LPS heptosyltransferase